MNNIYIKNGIIVTSENQFNGDILIENGIITKIGENLEIPKDIKIIDAKGKYICPGGIDPHTHIEMPLGGFSTSDDWISATKAAAAGGTTTIFDFVPIGKGDKHGEKLLEWLKVAERSLIDYTFHMSVVDWNEEVKESLELALKHGINSAKCYLAYKGRIMLDSDKDFLEFFSFASQHGMLPLAHCEDGEIITYLQDTLISQGKTSPKYHPESRPSWCEGTAVKHAISFATATNCPLYVVHNTCADAINVLKNSNDTPMPIFGECTICHLTLTKELNDNSDFNISGGAVLSPPLRTEFDRQTLWNSLRSGILKTIATDHCPIDLQYKKRGINDFRKIPNGCPAIEERMILTWHYGVHQGLISPSEFVSFTSTNSAKIFGLYPKKGEISIGSDGDLIIIDPKAFRIINHNNQISKVDYNLWENQKVFGIPIYTISKGEIIWECDVINNEAIYKEGKLTNNIGRGKFISRKPYVPLVYGRSLNK